MSVSWLDLVTAAFTGGFFVKLLDIAYSEYERKNAKQSSSKELLDKHIDPILKSADELLGKLLSLAKEDFKSLCKNCDEVQLGYVVYLFANFWARLAILRKESVSEHLSISKKGEELLQFVATLEARRNRIVSRAFQRGIAESIIEYHEETLQPKTFYSFSEEYLRLDSPIRRWVEPLRCMLVNTSQKDIRHKVIFYATLLHALVDTLDSERKYIRERQAYPNKLTEAMRHDLRYRVFREYLPMVKNSEKYWQISPRNPER